MARCERAGGRHRGNSGPAVLFKGGPRARGEGAKLRPGWGAEQTGALAPTASGCQQDLGVPKAGERAPATATCVRFSFLALAVKKSHSGKVVEKFYRLQNFLWLSETSQRLLMGKKATNRSGNSALVLWIMIFASAHP
ncbi:unnamed protein product [Rangifer tarandus platyrhynchus]|uniref:Uncharacterized protein n=2 Tax=Rangifer tarandus platyrhynchus TaxID=3082113 RepID=A0ABN8ZDU8_RANTA|nr:unnamed protein product [Rangifer tarandus platyrhynchus]CAI9707218.1 unnamed protein product [Rangifer tarandus platyrhynchus]